MSTGHRHGVMRKTILRVAIILNLGLIATLLSGLYRQDYSMLGANRVGYGLPMTYYRGFQEVVMEPPPMQYSFYGEYLVLDLTFWSLVVALPFIVKHRFLNRRANR